nr:50S ribosomal protein L20 isoform X1 [Drosophila takahashii]
MHNVYFPQHYRSRTRNVYSFAIRSVHRALAYATKGRKLKKLDMAQLWSTRVEAGCQQYGVGLETFKDGLARSDILLNKKVLSDLAIWEPRSFEALVKISRERAAVEGMPDIKRRSAFNQVYGLSNHFCKIMHLENHIKCNLLIHFNK